MPRVEFAYRRPYANSTPGMRSSGPTPTEAGAGSCRSGWLLWSTRRTPPNGVRWRRAWRRSDQTPRDRVPPNASPQPSRAIAFRWTRPTSPARSA